MLFELATARPPVLAWLAVAIVIGCGDNSGPDSDSSDDDMIVGDSCAARNRDNGTDFSDTEPGNPMRAAAAQVETGAPVPVGAEAHGINDSGGGDTEPQLSFSFGEPHLKITAAKQRNWSMPIAADSLSRRMLGLRWNVRPKGLLWSEEFDIWPAADNDVSDARLYRLAQMLAHDPWVVSVEPVLAGPEFVPPTGDEGRLPIDDPVWYLGPLGINAYQAWAMFEEIGKKPGLGVLIGLTDTGYLDHPELFRDSGTTQLRLDLQRNFSEPSKANDAHDFCNTLCGLTLNKTVKLAYVGHGTTTASLIISPPGRQPGTVGHLYAEGAAQYSEVIPIRVSPSVLMTPAAMGNLARGIRYATEQRA
ncbi:MAG: hypothetical protein MUF54_25125, partial [Polyangiaceae bacterium]|nr:hypothetical protein [Polyangiaceae bacterium]